MKIFLIMLLIINLNAEELVRTYSLIAKNADDIAFLTKKNKSKENYQDLSTATLKVHSNKQPSTNIEAILKLDTKGHTGMIRDIIVTKDKSIISASVDKSIRVWDSKTGKEKYKILGNIGRSTEGSILSIALSNNEKYLAVSGFFRNYGYTIRIYSFNNGKLIKVLKSNMLITQVESLAFSEDDKLLVSSNNGGATKLWNVENNFSLQESIKLHKNGKSKVKIIKQLNDYFIVSAGDDMNVVLYDIGNKKVIKSIKVDSKLYALAVNNKLKHIAVSGTRLNNQKVSKIFIYDFHLNLIKIIKQKTDGSALAYSEDGKLLIVGTSSRPLNVNIYNVDNDYVKKSSFNKHTNTVLAVAFLDNNTAISAGGNKNKIYIWNVNNAKVKKKIVGVGKTVWALGIKGNSIAWSDKYLKHASTQNVNYIQEGNSDPLYKSINIKTFKVDENITKSRVSYGRISTVNGNYTLSQSKIFSYSESIKRLEIKNNGKLEATIIAHNWGGIRHNIYGWYKDFIIVGGSTGRLTVYDKSGVKIGFLSGHSGEIWSLALDGDRLVSAGEDQIIKLWDLSKSKNYGFRVTDVFKNSLAEQSGILKNDLIYSVNGINFLDPKELIKYLTPSGKYNFLINRNNKSINISINKTNGLGMKFINYRIFKPILNIFVSKDNEWVAWTKEGFFNASKGGSKYIGYHINQGANKEAEYVTVDALYSTFYRPDLIQKALAGEDLAKYAKNINIYKLLKDGLAPEVHILTKTTNTKKQDMDLKVQVCPKGKGGYDNLTLLINDTPVSVINTSRALRLKKKSKRDDCFIYDQTISLAGGVNNIGFRATNKAGNIESKPEYLKVIFDDVNLKKKLRHKLSKIANNQNINDLHILAIAVNEYKDKDLKLNYSINDATVMLSTIEEVAKPLFNKIHTYKLFDANVTKENIKQAFSKIKSTRDDVFLLYIAGHGITDEYNGNYYYIPYDFINKDDEKAVQSQGVGQKDLMLGLSSVTALKSLVLLDTCNSGSFVEANMQKTTTGRLARATGRATISASSKSQVALEGYKGHGVFTYTLIEALKGKGYKGNKKITINELNDYVTDTLPDRTSKKWGYRQIPQSSMYGTDFNIGAK